MELCCNFCENMQLKMFHIARIKQHKEEGVFVWSHNCYHDCAEGGMAVETCHVIVCIHQSLMMYQSSLNGKSPVCRHFCVLSLYVPYFLPLSHKRLMRYCCHPAGRVGGRTAWTPEFLNWITWDQCDIGLWNSTPSTKNLKPFCVPVTLTSRSDEDVMFSEKSCECNNWRM